MLQEGFITFFEIIKAILMGIVEGITEWLPISSTGHMILVEQVVKFNASEEFMSMFRVVIQLGAILAVVVLFWNKLWPFGLRQGKVISKPSVWNLWFKVVAATLPVLVISPLDDWMEAHFYNYITVAAMLILLALGASDETICADFVQTNVCRKAEIDALLAGHAEEIAADPSKRMRFCTQAGVDPGAAPYVLQVIREACGSAEEYLAREYGLTPARRMRLRRMYLE